ncbi:TMV resistance protein N [Vitis vinifera]|uniref:TMV resistance protein N n=1 Tax=Vitis vinifera TaxID=29760 RepID=A0A438C7Y8_VITVI|nr:TMV resistance protein N [Vitis vinifera]
MEVSKEVIGYAQGLPLALEVLDDKEKNILLDIACFFKGEDKDYVMEILDGCGFFSLSGIRALIDKSLVTISWSNEIMMHDLIQEMGREIVRQQSLEEPGKRSRLWFHEDINGILKKNTVLANLKFMDLSHSKYLIETPNFRGVTNLKRLVLEGCVSLRKVHSSLGDLKNLIFLNLKNCQMLKSLPSSTCDLKSLETFILSGCSKFKEFPENFGSLEMLKELYVDEIAIGVLPSSFSFLRNLQILSFKGCKGPSSTLWLLPRRSSNSIGSILHLCQVRVVKPDTALAVLEASNPGIRIPHRASCQRIDPVVKLGIAIVALKAFIPGSRIPDWIRYQSSGSEVKAELPPNWFNSNFLGFAFSFVTCGHFSCLFTLKADVLFDWTSRDDSSSLISLLFEMISFKRRLESDHVCLCYVPLPQLRNCSQVTHIKVSFMAVSREVSQPLSLKKSMRRNLVEMGRSNVDGSEEVRRRNLELLLSALRIALNQMFGHRNA